MTAWTLLFLVALEGGDAGRVAATRVVDASIAPRELDPVVAALRARLAGSGFHWHEEACGLQPEPLACLRSLQPEAVVYATLARVGDGLILTLADESGIVGRFDAPADGRRLAGDLGRFMEARYPDAAAGRVRSESALPATVRVELDAQGLGRVERGTHLELERVASGPHRLTISAPNRVADPVEFTVAPGETSELRLRLRRLRTRSRWVHAALSASSFAAGVGLFAAGVASSNCDLLVDRPIGRCPDAFRPEVDLRIAGASALGFGVGLGLAELLVDRKQSAWVPLLLGLAVGGAGTAAAFAGY
ncbi:MAG: hypothetical protein AAF851_11995 [Myxococcota bacterium]